MIVMCGYDIFVAVVSNYYSILSFVAIEIRER